MDILIFIVVLAVLIFVHELGHFLAAKAFRIRVDSFAIGFPPTLFSYKYGETVYKLNLIPFGGYVKIFGESPNDETETRPDSPRNMMNRPVWHQVVVLLAGVVMNFILAWVLIAISYGIGVARPVNNIPPGAIVSNQSIVVLDVVTDSPADKAGFMVGDTILPPTDNIFDDAESFRLYTDKEGETLTFSVQQVLENEPTTQTIAVTPEFNTDLNKAVIGLFVEDIGIVKTKPLHSLWYGLRDTGIMTANVAVAFGDLIKNAFTGNAQLETLTGPVGLVGVVGDAHRLGIVYLLTLTALISVNLTILNLIPFPALDGGRILFLLIEKIKGSKIRPAIFNGINTLGFLLLIGLMIAVTVSDVTKLL